MKQYKIYLPILIVSLLILFVPRETYASVSWNWTNGSQLRMPVSSNLFYCSSSTSCTKQTNWQTYDLTKEFAWTLPSGSNETIYQDYQYFGNQNNIVFGNNDPGIIIEFKPDVELIKNYYYSINFYLCTSGLNLQLSKTYVGLYDTDFTELKYQTSSQGLNWLNVTNRPFTDIYNSPYTSCRNYNQVFKNSSLNYADRLGLLITSPSATTIEHLGFFGYNLVPLGADLSSLPTTASINTINTNINNVQSSVNNVQSSVNDVKNDTNAIKQEAKATNDTLNNDTVNESDNYLKNNIVNNSAFNQDHGITAIVQAPLNFIRSLSNKSCSSIVLPIPNLGNATIPCMSTIYNSKFSNLYNVLKIIINGILCYRMALSCVLIVKGAKNPNEDKIEVMDL